MAAATVLSSAVQAMRQAPGGKERAEELGRQLVELQEQAMSELKKVSTSIDASDLVQAAVRELKASRSWRRSSGSVRCSGRLASTRSERKRKSRPGSPFLAA